MKKVKVGVTTRISGTSPQGMVFLTLMGIARYLANRGRYALRQNWFESTERRKRDPDAELLPRPWAELSAVIRGYAEYHAETGTLVQLSRDPSWASAALAAVTDRVVRDVKDEWSTFLKTRDAFFAGKLPAGAGMPQPPGYAKEHQKLAWRLGAHARLGSDGLALSLAKGKSPAAIHSQPLGVPPRVRELLRAGARLVEVSTSVTRLGDVDLHWTLEVEAPSAPKDLAEALTLGPLACIDPGTGNLMALAYLDLRAATLPAPTHSGPAPAPLLPAGSALTAPLPAPTLVRGDEVIKMCHDARKSEAKLRSELPFAPRPHGGPQRQVRTSEALRGLRQRHDDRVSHAAHAAAKVVVEELTVAGARVLVWGWNKGIKQGPGKQAGALPAGQSGAATLPTATQSHPLSPVKKPMNKLQRFRFGSIPHREVARALAHKCALAGILFLEVDEAYTSKTSFPDAELPQYQSTYAGKRVKRGLFKTATGRLLNADVNAALQIGVRLLVGEGLLHLLTPQHRAEAVARSMNPVRTHVNLG